MKSLVLLAVVIYFQQAISSPTLWYEHTKLHKSLYGSCFYVGSQCAAANTICRILPPAFFSSDALAATDFLHSERQKRATETAVDSVKTPVKGRDGYGGSSYGSSSYGTETKEQPEYKYFDSRTDVQDQRTYTLPITVNTFTEQKKLVKKTLYNLYRQHEHEHLNTNVQLNVYKTDHPHVLTEYITYVQDKYQPIRYIHVKKSEVVQDKGVQDTPTEDVVRKTVQLPPEILPVETVQFGYDGKPLPEGAPALLPVATAPAAALAAPTTILQQKTGLNLYTESTAKNPDQSPPDAMTVIDPPSSSKWTRRKRASQPRETGVAVEERQKIVVHKPEEHAMCLCAETFVPAASGLGCECPLNMRFVDGRCV